MVGSREYDPRQWPNQPQNVCISAWHERANVIAVFQRIGPLVWFGAAIFKDPFPMPSLPSRNATPASKAIRGDGWPSNSVGAHHAVVNRATARSAQPILPGGSSSVEILNKAQDWLRLPVGCPRSHERSYGERVIIGRSTANAMRTGEATGC